MKQEHRRRIYTHLVAASACVDGNSDDLTRLAPTIRQALLNIPQPVGLFAASGDRRTASVRKLNEFGARTA